MTGYNPPLQVIGFIGTRPSDPERGPQVRINSQEAAIRLLADGELVWIRGPRRQELAPLQVDDAIPRGGAVLRDIAGVTLTDIIRLTKPDLDRPGRMG